jgi:hypothetical protein
MQFAEEVRKKYQFRNLSVESVDLVLNAHYNENASIDADSTDCAREQPNTPGESARWASPDHTSDGFVACGSFLLRWLARLVAEGFQDVVPGNDAPAGSHLPGRSAQ